LGKFKNAGLYTDGVLGLKDPSRPFPPGARLRSCA
jgi:hypothetical protein